MDESGVSADVWNTEQGLVVDVEPPSVPYRGEEVAGIDQTTKITIRMTKSAALDFVDGLAVGGIFEVDGHPFAVRIGVAVDD